MAAVIFLAVAWSWLGVGGRTATLVSLTAVAVGLGEWLRRRDLLVAAESLTVVGLGLLVLDLVGARDAGWLPVDDLVRFTGVAGLGLLAASLALLPGRLATPQVVAPVGLLLAGVGLGDVVDAVEPAAVAVVVGALALSRLRLPVLPWTALTAGLMGWLALVGWSLTQALVSPSLHTLWVGGAGWWLLAAAGLALVPGGQVRELGAAIAAALVTGTVALPALDEGATALVVAAAASVLVWRGALVVLPERWSTAAWVPLAGSLTALAPIPLLLAGQAAYAVTTVGAPFTATAGVRSDPPVLVAQPWVLALAVLAVLVAAPRRWWWVGPGVWLTVVLTAALYAAPLWVVVVALGPVGVVVALPSAVLTLVALLVLAGTAAAVRRPGVVVVALAGAVWTIGHLGGVPLDQRGLAVMGLVGLAALALPRREVELGGWTAAVVAVLAAGEPGALDLTVAGALLTASALVHRDRRELGWIGGLLLAAATWVRLADLGVQAPEPYTLPSALVLIALGLDRLRRDRGADTVPTLLPGLSLALVPSLLWALVEPLSTRAVAVGLASLLVLLAGTALRWTAPVLVGWVVGGLLVLRELAPYAVQVEQWVLIGAAGALLIGFGVTWESRLRDLQHASGYLRRLR